MNRNRKTYIATWGAVGVLPGAFQTPVVTINNNSNRCILKSVKWSVLLQNVTTGLPERWQINNDIITALNIGNIVPNNPLGFNFVSSAPPAPNNTGIIAMFEPGQYNFNNIFFMNELYFGLEFNNTSAVNQYNISCNLIVEIEELD